MLNSEKLLWALGPDLSAVVLEVHRETGVSIEAILTALIAVLGLVCQGRLRMRLRKGLISPVALWFIVKQDSGELKTAVIKKLLQGVTRFEAEQAVRFTQQLERHNAELRIWTATEKGLLKAIQKKAAALESTEEESAALLAHQAKKPQRPKRFKLVHERVSVTALHKNLAECFPTTSLLSDEAERVFRGQAMSDMGTLNKAYDGSDLISDRSSDGETVARDPSLTLLLMTQIGVFDSFLAMKGEHARSVGLLARCYIVTPPSSSGYRMITHSSTASDEVMEKFYDRCKEILESQIGDDLSELKEKVELYFSPEAQAVWEATHDNIQLCMRPGGYFQNDKDFAAKEANRIGRLSALLAFFEGCEGEISRHVLDRATALAEWFSGQFVSHFAKPPAIPQEQVDFNTLLVWLADYVRKTGLFLIKKNELRQGGPNSLRNIVRLNTTLLALWQAGIACEGKIPNDKAWYVILNGNYFTPAQVQLLCSQPAF
ncbi:YfjI family protein [Niveibacterium microcysteis]|uniref:DUF3987 domain-containing protein n=1 Tax=Niveibacterium microcysteis TaxID=2811415 RepID=A0ABX7M3M4_9RHOO|nr:YfjI family protein [Niveibacterium microcysteis]QSI76356.1 DUF3987 domain-containing protein [Niveibacterium microcysteis]